jgi:hypothetical protein
MTNSAQPFIHLGLPKTASTSIRFNLFAKHSQVHYLGKHIGGQLSTEIQFAVLKGVSLRETLLKRWQHSSPITMRTGSKTPVLSLENLSGDPTWKTKLQARHFRTTLGPCQIILVLREPVSFLKSFYAQMLRNFQEQPPNDRPRWMNAIGTPPGIFEIDEWLEQTWSHRSSPRNYISTADTALAYARVFGKQNVHLLLFENFVRDPDAFITHLSTLLNIDPQESIRLLQKKRSNPRLTTDYIDRVREVQQSPDLLAEFQTADPTERRNILDQRSKTGEKISPDLSEKWLATVAAHSRKQNRRLLQHWDLPLCDYGYQI